MDRNSRTPRLAAHYRPAPPIVWLQAFAVACLAAVATVAIVLITR
ncbi:MAG: hypothetical protein NXH91_14115 [Phyllobacteriaceae bacterium]|jgi:hypothetical protein|nr:hypothetical protein [Phyllobacteriaceae bacterium]